MEPGLDFAFLKYIGVTPESQIPIRRFYLPMFAGCQHVVDLGCGTGDFVALLQEAGINAVGVDSDPAACAWLQKRQLPVIEQEVTAYLETIEANSLDGIYSAHLVEHMPYEAVLKLIRLAFRALRPGGRLVLATPNPRALISHLELYHMHFGHKAFYHPNLLCFFLDYCGFEQIEDGENPFTIPLFSRDLFQGFAPPYGEYYEAEDLNQAHIRYRREFPPAKNPLRALIRLAKTTVFRFIVQPFLDDLEGQANRLFLAHHTALRQTGVMDRAFECYAIGYKPALPTPQRAYRYT